jgi:hypothetical protein
MKVFKKKLKNECVRIRKLFFKKPKIQFMRDIFAHVGKTEKNKVAKKLTQFWNQTKRKTALQLAELFTKDFVELFLQVSETLQQGLEDWMQFFDFPKFNVKRIS